MSASLFVSMPSGAALAGIAEALVAGLLLGAVFFESLWRSALLLVEGGGALMAAALTIGRFGLLAGFLISASVRGAGPLLAMASGVIIARALFLRRIREAAK